jgi:hypothetical protein
VATEREGDVVIMGDLRWHFTSTEGLECLIVDPTHFVFVQQRLINNRRDVQKGVTYG